jgi:hypothetical protein
MGIRLRRPEAFTDWSGRAGLVTIVTEVVAVLSDEELRALVERELADDIERRLRAGASRDEVVTALVEEGFLVETAGVYVDGVIAPTRPRRSRWRAVLAYLTGAHPGAFPNDPGGSGSLHLRG